MFYGVVQKDDLGKLSCIVQERPVFSICLEPVAIFKGEIKDKVRDDSERYIVANSHRELEPMKIRDVCEKLGLSECELYGRRQNLP